MFNVVPQFFYYRHVLCGTGILQKPAYQWKGVDIILRRALKKDIPRLQQVVDPRYQCLLKKKHLCIIAEKNNDIIGYTLLTPHAIDHECGYLHVQPKKGEWISANTKILKEFRGKGIFTAMHECIFSQKGKPVFKNTCYITDYKNKAAQKVAMRCGSAPPKHIIFIVFFHHFKFFIKNEDPQRVSFTLS